MRSAILLGLLAMAACQAYVPDSSTASNLKEFYIDTARFEKGSWQHFLQNLPVKPGNVVDYTGRPVSNQDKVFAILQYDVGSRDLQQCADALMRLRAEYLFKEGRSAEIKFHFTSGQLFTYSDYLKGNRAVVSGNRVKLVKNASAIENTHAALRKYLDVVYTYAGTISLAKELKPADDFEVGVIVITPGSPGHCFIIVDQMINGQGEKRFKLVEGYTPAQTMYVLKNPVEPSSPWHKLVKGKPISTASYDFVHYKLGKFE